MDGASMDGARLLGAKNVTHLQLQQAKSLLGATMPDGTKLAGPDNPDGPTLEGWIQSLETVEQVDKEE